MTSEHDPGSAPRRGYLTFIQVAIAALLALLVADVGGLLGRAATRETLTAETVLLVALVFVLVELLVVLSDLHVKHLLPYSQPWLYMDVLIGLLFFWFASSISASGVCRLPESGCAADLRPAMRIGIVVFTALLIRLLVGYRLLVTVRQPDTEIKRSITLRSVANAGGVLLSIAVLLAEPDGFLGLGTFGWSLIGGTVLIVYFVVRSVGPYRLALLPVAPRDRPRR